MRTRIVIRNVRLAALVVACVITGLVYVIPAAAGAIRPGPASGAAGPAVPPRIGGVSPATAPASSTINITGAGFLLTRVVAIGGTSASFRIVSPFLIQAVVPRTAGPGLISVTTNYGTAKSPKRFIVSPSIWFNLPYGPPTTNVTVSGSGFGPSEQVAVTFGGTALPLAPTDSKGVFQATPYQLPSQALPGTQAVTALGQTSGLSAAASFLVNTDWATMHDDLTRSGLNPYENVLNSGNVSGLTTAWSYATGNLISSSPTEVDGVVYIGSADANLYALNATTGALIWKFQTTGNGGVGGTVESPPTVANGVVYFGSYDDYLYALNAATGTLLWSYKTGNNVETSPAVVNGVVYFGSDDTNVYALNATTGALIWRFKTTGNGGNGGLVGSSPAVVGGVVYVGSDDQNVYAFNAAGCGAPTCAALWSVLTSDFVVSSPAVANGMVFVGSNDWNVYAFKLPPPGPRPHRRLPPNSPQRVPQRRAW
jgi:PQQ-like domain/PQQ enzyme repeat